MVPRPQFIATPLSNFTFSLTFVFVNQKLTKKSKNKHSINLIKNRHPWFALYISLPSFPDCDKYYMISRLAHLASNTNHEFHDFFTKYYVFLFFQLRKRALMDEQKICFLSQIKIIGEKISWDLGFVLVTRWARYKSVNTCVNIKWMINLLFLR